MKKKQLLKLLSKIPDNEEILYWNASVGDTQEFRLDEVTQVKQTFEEFKFQVNARAARDGKPEESDEALLKEWKILPYETSKLSHKDYGNSAYYSIKVVKILAPIKKNRTSLGFSGSIEY